MQDKGFSEEKTIDRSVVSSESGSLLPVGSMLAGRFVIEKILGTGGMGTVYAARDEAYVGQERVAIKMLSPRLSGNAAAVSALEKECRRSRRLAHDSIVRVFEFFRSEGQVFFTMELLQGKPLSALIVESPCGLDIESAWPIVRDVGSALSYAHSRDPPWVHYDLKPLNVFVTATGAVKLLDFGVARAAVETVKKSETRTLLQDAVIGLTTMYASPEMLQGMKPDVRDDVFSFACVVYELLSGRHPFCDRDVGSALQAQGEGLKYRAIEALSGAENNALAKALRFVRSERTPSVDLFLRELGADRFVDPPRNSTKWLIAVAAGAVLIGVASFFSSSVFRKAPSIDVHRVEGLYQLLGIDLQSARKAPKAGYRAEDVMSEVAVSPRRVTLGSSPEQVQFAIDLCLHYGNKPDCVPETYSDETPRTVTLRPYELDHQAVSRRDFAEFAAATGYISTAERDGVSFRYDTDKGAVKASPAASWRNGVGGAEQDDLLPVVGVSIEDAHRYCAWKKSRLPTEDEWEYAARTPKNYVFPWGDNLAVAIHSSVGPMQVAAGPSEGVQGVYRGLSGNVWEWVDTHSHEGDWRLKGGAWVDKNPANSRAAAHRDRSPIEQYEGRSVYYSDSISGFRCARSVEVWPDANYWITTIS